jgi:hypothetical protein
MNSSTQLEQAIATLKAKVPRWGCCVVDALIATLRK